MLTVRYLAREPLFRSPRLSIRGVGIREVMPPCFVRRPGGTGDFLFMLFHDTVQLGKDESAVAEPGTLLLWERKAAHFYGNPQRRWSHSWVHCDGSFIRAAWRAAAIPSAHPIALPHPSRVEDYLFTIHEELTGQMPPDALILRNTLENLIREAARSREPRPLRPPIPQNLAAVRDWIETEYDQPLTLEQLAARAGLSLPHFCTTFRRHFGIPPIAYLIHRRMHAAAILLREAALPVGEVGRRVGYDDPYYFSKHFKACFGLPPSRHAVQGSASPAGI